MKKNLIHNAAWILVLLFTKFTLITWAETNPEQVEKWYSRGVYPYIATILTTISNAFSFSLGEVMIAVFVVGTVITLVGIVSSLIVLHPMEAFKQLVALVLVVSVMALYIDVSWLLNNYRQGFADLSGMQVRTYSETELEETFAAVILKTNALKQQLDEGIALNTEVWNVSDVLLSADDGYSALHEKFDFISEGEVHVKGLMSSPIQSKSGYTGIYLFFVGEPTVNNEIPLVTLPHTASHEIAHQKGFAFEDEANYVGFLACQNHQSLLFRYSGYFAALRYLAGALSEQDRELYKSMSVLYSDGVKADLIENNTFWQTHQDEKITKMADTANENYLITYNQPEGLKSYGLFVDLLIADYLADGEI